jgi:hypothetical protein
MSATLHRNLSLFAFAVILCPQCLPRQRQSMQCTVPELYPYCICTAKHLKIMTIEDLYRRANSRMQDNAGRNRVASTQQPCTEDKKKSTSPQAALSCQFTLHRNSNTKRASALDIATETQQPSAMLRLQVFRSSRLRPVEAIETRIAVIAPERVQKDNAQNRLQFETVRTPHKIIALACWAFGHHGGSVLF